MLVLLLVFVAGRCLVPMDETDLFFNLRLGEIIVGSGHVPGENLLSFTYPHAPDINLAWLFQLLLALAYRLGGIPATVLLKTGFVVATWLVLYRVAVRRGAHPVATALALALAAWAAEPRFVERPHLVTFLGLALLLLAIETAEAGRPGRLWLMVPVGLVWANANSCFFLAPSLLALYALGAWAEGRVELARRGSWVALALVPLVLATPSGAGAMSYIANHFRMPSLRPLQEYRHAEWPLDGPYFFLVAGLLLAAVLPRLRYLRVRVPHPLGAARAGRGPARSWPVPAAQARIDLGRWSPLLVPRRAVLVPHRVLLPVLALALLGGLRIRFVAELAILAGPALALALSRALPARTWRWGRVAAVLLLLAATAVPRVASARAGQRVFELGIEQDLVPLAAIAFAEQHGLRERMYNDLEVGSYLSWQGWPRYRVFQDPRINSYPAAFHAVLRRADLTRAEFEALLGRFAVTSALITYPTLNPRAALFDPERWALVYRARDGLIFVRRSAQRDLAELPLTFSYVARDGVVPVALRQRPQASKTSECEWQRRLGDYDRSTGALAVALGEYQAGSSGAGDPACRAEARQSAGTLALERGDFAAAAALLEGATAPAARVNHGFALLGLGLGEAALAELDSVLASAPGNDEALFGRGLCLVALGRLAEADAALATLLARSPHHVAADAARSERARLRERRDRR
ncbi:MAG: tetratricopeptide repeat protein [Polyangia bacterium]